MANPYFPAGTCNSVPFLMVIIMIYVACPGGYKTGGTELLHQFAHELSKYTDVCMYYIEEGLIDEFAEYQTDYVYSLPDNDDYVVVPEIWARMNIGNHRRIIYWESVDNYLIRDTNTVFDDDIIHISQTEYSYQFLTNEVHAVNIIRITDYINDKFTAKFKEGKRKPVVLYNPLKGMQYTQKVIDQSSYEFVPIIGKSRDEIIKMMREAMVYIDLGHHPGKDRLPREAAASGCAILTSLEGSARFYEDVPIPDKYKFDRDDTAAIVEMVGYMLTNYDTVKKDFTAYRKAIKAEKGLFIKGVAELYEVLNHNTRIQ